MFFYSAFVSLWCVGGSSVDILNKWLIIRRKKWVKNRFLFCKATNRIINGIIAKNLKLSDFIRKVLPTLNQSQFIIQRNQLTELNFTPKIYFSVFMFVYRWQAVVSLLFLVIWSVFSIIWYIFINQLNRIISK